jgi:hypothetical protein
VGEINHFPLYNLSTVTPTQRDTDPIHWWSNIHFFPYCSIRCPTISTCNLKVSPYVIEFNCHFHITFSVTGHIALPTVPCNKFLLVSLENVHNFGGSSLYSNFFFFGLNLIFLAHDRNKQRNLLVSRVMKFQGTWNVGNSLTSSRKVSFPTRAQQHRPIIELPSRIILLTYRSEFFVCPELCKLCRERS